VTEKTGGNSSWQPMLGAPPGRLRLLGNLLRLRRAAIGYRHVPAFTRDRPINTRMVGDIEHGRRDTYTHPTLKDDVAPAYEVTYESMLAVVWSDAGELVPAGEVPGEPAPPAAAPPDPSSPFADQARTDLNRPWFDPLNERRVRLAARGITDPDGGQMFPDAPGDAEAWDGIAESITVGDKVWILADLRRRAAARAAGAEANSHGALTA